jgi:hypothetical protein
MCVVCRLSYGSHAFVHAVFGGLDLLLYRCERVILSIDFKVLIDSLLSCFSANACVGVFKH